MTPTAIKRTVSKPTTGGRSRADEFVWQGRAACKGPQSAAFFPPTQTERRDEREAREQRAKAICAGCPVHRACLDYALSIREPHGIWGGLNESERRELLVTSS